MIKSILQSVDISFKPSKEELLQLTDYLFKVEKWGYYEITLLGNSVRSLEYSSYFLLTQEMLKNYIFISLNPTNKKLVTQLAINCLLLSVDKKEFKNSDFLIREITKLLNNEFNFFEKTIFLYATGYLEYAKNSNDGHEKMKNAIQVLELLNEENLKSHYTEHYENLLK